MLKQIVEISKPGYSLTIKRGFLCITSKDDTCVESQKKIAVSDIGAIIFTNSYSRVSGSVLTRLANQGAIICVSDRHYQPTSVMIPLSAHHESGLRVQLQADLNQKNKGLIWADIIQAKVINQYHALRMNDVIHKRLYRLIAEISIGDPKNIEAMAARIYWKKMFGDKFKRDKQSGGVNSFLNYGYAILRACLLRFLSVHGLSPSLGVHHSNSRNPFKLADDLMEPYRPFVDLAVKQMKITQEIDLAPQHKKELVNLIYSDFKKTGRVTNLWNCINQTVESFVSVLNGEENSLSYPLIGQGEKYNGALKL